MADVLLIDLCNFEDFPVGGHLSFARQMIQAFGNRLALVGISTDDTPVGRWIENEIDGVVYTFFAVGRWIPSSRKSFIPARITGYLQTRKYKTRILALGIRSVFVQRPETLFAVQDWGWDSICYCCAGVTNPLTKPRYGWGKLFTGVFLRKWVSALADVDVILAAADDRAIDAFVARSGGKLIKDRIIKFPTRVDTSLFRPMDKTAARKELGINVHVPLIVNCGRINAVKDWKLLVDSFYMLSRNMSDARLVFVGDGEDRPKLEDYVDRLGLSAHVTITGFLPPMNVVKYFNAADVCAVSSHYEGWSVAMLEALACRKPIVSTAVSGARDMIVEGVNGYIVEKRDPKCFVKAMVRALSISEPEQTSLCIAEKYSLKNLSKDLATLWKPLA